MVQVPWMVGASRCTAPRSVSAALLRRKRLHAGSVGLVWRVAASIRIQVSIHVFICAACNGHAALTGLWFAQDRLLAAEGSARSRGDPKSASRKAST
jgi:hypothetical protein